MKTLLILLVSLFAKSSVNAAVVALDNFYTSIEVEDLDEFHTNSIGYATFATFVTTDVDMTFSRYDVGVSIFSASGQKITPKVMHLNVNTDSDYSNGYFMFNKNVTQNVGVNVWFTLDTTEMVRVTLDSFKFNTPDSTMIVPIGYRTNAVFIEGVPEPKAFALSLIGTSLILLRRRG